LRLDRKIAFEKPTTVRNDFGEEVVTYMGAKVAWANVRFGFGTERQERTDKQRMGNQEVFFTVRFFKPVDLTWIIIHEGIRYQILAISEVQRRHYLEIKAEERDNDR
jgi:head-tail adaptor